MSYDTTPPPDTSLKVAHLVFGLLFLGLAGIWALGHSGLIEDEQLLILAPGVLVLAGIIGLAASLASARNRRHRDLPDGLPDGLPGNDDEEGLR